MYSLHELKALLAEAGWKYRDGLGSVIEDEIELVPLEVDSFLMWVVAQR